jgi:hypothetical protein
MAAVTAPGATAALPAPSSAELRTRYSLNETAINERLLRLQNQAVADVARQTHASREELIRHAAAEMRSRTMQARYAYTLEKLQKVRKCLRCGEWFRRASSLGAWQCTTHTGKLRSSMVNEADCQSWRVLWTCCDQLWLPQQNSRHDGCTRCDHTDRENGPSAGIEAYLIYDADLFHQLTAYRHDAIVPVYETTDAPVRFRGDWARGQFQALVSKLDRGAQSSVISASDAAPLRFHNDMREQDAMMVKRAQPRPATGYIETPYSLPIGAPDPVRARGETSVAIADADPYGYYGNGGGGGATAMNVFTPAISQQRQQQQQRYTSRQNAFLVAPLRTAYLISTCATEPDPRLVKK